MRKCLRCDTENYIQDAIKIKKLVLDKKEK